MGAGNIYNIAKGSALPPRGAGACAGGARAGGEALNYLEIALVFSCFKVI